MTLNTVCFSLLSYTHRYGKSWLQRKLMKIYIWTVRLFRSFLYFSNSQCNPMLHWSRLASRRALHPVQRWNEQKPPSTRAHSCRDIMEGSCLPNGCLRSVPANQGRTAQGRGLGCSLMATSLSTGWHSHQPTHPQPVLPSPHPEPPAHPSLAGTRLALCPCFQASATANAAWPPMSAQCCCIDTTQHLGLRPQLHNKRPQVPTRPCTKKIFFTRRVSPSWKKITLGDLSSLSTEVVGQE